MSIHDSLLRLTPPRKDRVEERSCFAPADSTLSFLVILRRDDSETSERIRTKYKYIYDVRASLAATIRVVCKRQARVTDERSCSPFYKVTDEQFVLRTSPRTFFFFLYIAFT